MDQPFDIELADGARSELAVALGDTILENLRRHPEREESFRKLRSCVLVRADDTDVAITLGFKAGGRLRIYDGEVGAAHICILGESDAILALTRMPLRLGLPDPFSEPARLVLKRQLGGELTVRGLVLRLPEVARLLRLLASGY